MNYKLITIKFISFIALLAVIASMTGIAIAKLVIG